MVLLHLLLHLFATHLREYIDINILFSYNIYMGSLKIIKKKKYIFLIHISTLDIKLNPLKHIRDDSIKIIRNVLIG